jgi:putative spermidine/putrescine transport system substrate-binding protein
MIALIGRRPRGGGDAQEKEKEAVYQPDRRTFLKQAAAAGMTLAGADVLLAACGGGGGGNGGGQSGGGGSSNQQVHLTEFTWVGSGQDVQPPKVRAAYEKQHPNVKIDFSPGTNAETYPKIVQSLQVDPNNPLINFGFFNIDAMTKGTQAGIWTPFDPKLVTNLSNVFPAYRRPQNKGVFFALSSIGLMYNKERVDPPPTSWKDLWAPRFKGKVAFWDAPNWSFNGLVETARLHGGGEKNIEPGMKVYEDAAKSGQIQSLYTSNDAGKQLLVSGAAWITPFFFGVMEPWVVNEKAPLGYVVPKEGQIAFPLGFAVVKGSSDAQKKASEEIINTMLTPEFVGEWCNLTYGLPAVKGASIKPELKNLDAYKEGNIANAIQLDWATIAKNNNDWLEQWNSRVKANLK